MLEASEYYEAQAPFLGREFLDEARRTVQRIAENPFSGQVVRPPIRRWLVRRFPFGILYSIDADEIVILAIMHLRRFPGYWADRV